MKPMLNEQENRRKKIQYGVILLLSLIVTFFVIWSLRNILLATHDDLGSYLKVKVNNFSGHMSESITAMLQRGRISPIQILANALYFFVAQSSSQFLFQVMLYLPIVFNVAFFAYIAGKKINKYIGMLIPVFFFSLVQVDINHNLMISYPLFFHIGFTTFLIGLYLFIKYQEKPKERYLWISALCMFDSFSAYESFVTYFAVFMALAIVYNASFTDRKFHFKIKAFFKQTKYHIIITVVYFVFYVICRNSTTFKYGGAAIDFATFDWGLAFQTLFSFSFSLFPLREFFFDEYFRTFTLSAVSLSMILKALAAAGALGLVLFKSSKINLRRLLKVIAVALVACIVFCIPHALTPQYQYWVSIGTEGFVPSFFSYMWIVLILCALGIYLCNLNKKLKPIIIVILSLFMFFGSIATDYSNSITIAEKQADTIKYKMFDRLTASPYYSSLEDGAAIYVEGYTGIHMQIASLGAYGNIYCPKSYHYSTDIDKVMAYKDKYYLWYDESSQSIFLANIEKAGIGDEVFVMSYDDDQSNDTLYAIKTPQIGAVNVDGQEAGKFEQYISLPVSTENGALITADNMILSTCELYDGNESPADNQVSDPYGKVIKASESDGIAEFSLGWYDKEEWGLWSKSEECYLMLLLPDSSGKDIKVDMDVQVLEQPKGLSVEIECMNEVIFDQSILDNGKISFVIPSQGIESNMASLEIHVKNAVSPADIGLSVDARKLGIGIKDLTLNIQ